VREFDRFFEAYFSLGAVFLHEVKLCADQDDIPESASRVILLVMLSQSKVCSSSHVTWVSQEIIDLAFKTLESVTPGDVVDGNTPLRVSEIGLADRLESLLASSVPHL